MTSKDKHQKHAEIARPAIGRFHRNELAIIGAPCSLIQDLAVNITGPLENAGYQLAYVDADHSGESGEEQPIIKPSVRYTDKISFFRMDSRSQLNEFQQRPLFSDRDLVVVNGNHFRACSQIVIINESKRESLSRKLDRLTDVQLVLVENDKSDIYPFLREVLEEHTPVIRLGETSEIVNWFTNWLNSRTPVLNGLVLSGGKSTRLGQDKTLLTFHGKPQKEHMYEVLAKFCAQVCISDRPKGDSAINGDDRILVDTFTGLGPFGGILTAFREWPDNAWLVAASDLPLAGTDALAYLVERRNPSKVATAFLNPDTGFPDPLLTIWEPRAYPVLLNFLAQGYSCPRKALINSEIELVEVPDKSWLFNVNTPDDLAKVRELLAK